MNVTAISRGIIRAGKTVSKKAGTVAGKIGNCFAKYPLERKLYTETTQAILPKYVKAYEKLHHRSMSGEMLDIIKRLISYKPMKEKIVEKIQFSLNHEDWKSICNISDAVRSSAVAKLKEDFPKHFERIMRAIDNFNLAIFFRR